MIQALVVIRSPLAIPPTWLKQIAVKVKNVVADHFQVSTDVVTVLTDDPKGDGEQVDIRLRLLGVHQVEDDLRTKLQSIIKEETCGEYRAGVKFTPVNGAHITFNLTALAVSGEGEIAVRRQITKFIRGLPGIDPEPATLPVELEFNVKAKSNQIVLRMVDDGSGLEETVRAYLETLARQELGLQHVNVAFEPLTMPLTAS